MRFGFYVNPVGWLRGPDGSTEPEPALLAGVAASAGAQIVLAGWTPAKSTLAERDYKLLRELVHVDLMLVVPAGSEHVETVVKLRPEGVMMVAPGWDGRGVSRPVPLEGDTTEITASAAAYQAAGLMTSALVEPLATAVKAAARVGVKGAVLDCATYSAARTDADAQAALDRLADAAMAAEKFGLVPAAAGGLTYAGIGPVAALKYLQEVYVGRSVTNRALLVGMDRAVAEIVAVIGRSRAG
jgi:pyridoxine 5-phosphate synthase